MVMGSDLPVPVPDEDRALPGFLGSALAGQAQGSSPVELDL